MNEHIYIIWTDAIGEPRTLVGAFKRADQAATVYDGLPEGAKVERHILKIPIGIFTPSCETFRIAKEEELGNDRVE